MSSTINEILNEVRNNPIVEIDPSKYKFAYSEFSKTENMMNTSDYRKHLHDVKLRGELNHPIVIVNGKILDGRNRQKACIELGIAMKVLYLKGTYTDEVLFEYVRSIHMTKSKNAVQRQIQAYRYKQTVGNVTWSQASDKYGCTERSVKTINTMFNVLNENGYKASFNPIIEKLFMGLSIKPTDYEWVSKPTASCYSLNNMLKEFIDQEYKRQEKGQIDTTEIDPDTGEFLEKQDNYYNNINDKKDNKKDIVIKELEDNVQELTKSVKAKDEEINVLKGVIEELKALEVTQSISEVPKEVRDTTQTIEEREEELRYEEELARMLG